MRKIIALTTLIAAGTTLAATTSKKDLKTEEMTLAERVSSGWYLEPQKGDLSSNAADANMYTSIDIRYKLNKKMEARFNPRFQIEDGKTDENGDELDRFTEYDPRIRLGGSYLLDGVYTMTDVIPGVTDSSIDKDKIAEIRFYNETTVKVDDFNSMDIGVSLRRNFFSEDQEAEPEFKLLPYYKYTNAILSEKYKLRFDYEGYLSHVPGKNINVIKHDQTSERILAGVHMSKILGTNSVFPYIQNNLSIGKTENIGAGVQVFKKF